jgi:hypothetical protein
MAIRSGRPSLIHQPFSSSVVCEASGGRLIQANKILPQSLLCRHMRLIPADIFIFSHPRRRRRRSALPGYAGVLGHHTTQTDMTTLGYLLSSLYLRFAFLAFCCRNKADKNGTNSLSSVRRLSRCGRLLLFCGNGACCP